MEILFMSQISRFSIVLTNGKVDHLNPWEIQIVGDSFVTQVGRVKRKRSGIVRKSYQCYQRWSRSRKKCQVVRNPN